jgi:hypothetical protein
MNSTTTPQLLPLHIEHDGPAPIDTYFNIDRDDNGNKVATFRGRMMYGVDLALPEGYAGVVLQTDEESAAKPDKKSTGSRKSARARGKEEEHDNDASGTRLDPAPTAFTEIGLWRADVPVDLKSDEYARALDEWTRMAALVSCPDAVAHGHILLHLQADRQRLTHSLALSQVHTPDNDEETEPIQK